MKRQKSRCKPCADAEGPVLGHLLAAERGRIGERYILGNRNMTLKEFFQLLAKATGKRAPVLRLPYLPVLTAAYFDAGISKSVYFRSEVEMAEAERDNPDAVKDRMLGDEWNGWNSQAGLRAQNVDEKLSTFLLLATAVLSVCVALLLFTWFIIKPRFEQFSPIIASLAGWIVAGFVVCLVLAIAFEGMLLIRQRKSLFPYKWIENFFLSLLPRTIWIGEKPGISRDRIGNSFIKAHNFSTKTYADRLLVLLPRCLKKEARARLISRLSGNNYKVCTAAGGEEAREAIRQYRPSSILAIACERDLMSGIKDVAEKITVLAIPNKSPEGTCGNTEFDMDELEEALKFLTTTPAKKVYKNAA